MTTGNYPLEKLIRDKKPIYTRVQAQSEANRCLYCYDAPCIKACPTEIDIPGFIRKIANDNVKGAAKAIFTANVLGNSCARVCPVEVLCAKECVYHEKGEEPIQIGRLQRYATENAMRTLNSREILGEPKESSGKKVALIGAGPASLAAAKLLSLQGHNAVIFEKNSYAGGLNAAGIAPYKLKSSDAQAEIDWLMDALVEIKLGVEVSADKDATGCVSAKTLEKDFDAIFIGVGLGADKLPGIEKEMESGVYGASALIEKIKRNPNFSLDSVETAHVIGGGNTAIDIAHELSLLGVKNVFMLYRKGEHAMSGYKHELSLARSDGVHFMEDAVLQKLIHRDGKLVGILTSLSEQIVPTDLVAFAIGQNGATQIAEAFENVALDEKGRIIVNANHKTHHEKIWSGGDCTNGGKEVVNAVAEAKIAVSDMLLYLDSLEVRA